MRNSEDPPRWSEANADAPDQLQQLLRAARRDLPDAREMEAMGLTTGAILTACATSAIGSGLGSAAASGSLAQAPAAAPLTGAGVGTAGASSAASGTFVTKVAIGVLLASGAGAGLWLTRGAEPQPQPSTVAPPEVVAAPSVSPHPEVLPEVVASPELEPPAAPQQSATIAAADERAPRVNKAPVSTPSEVALLKQAQQALKADPERALALTSQHARHYPSGNLVQEREVIRIEALRRLGRDSEAKRLGDRFDERFPDSAHRSKVGTTDDGPSKGAP